MMFSLNVMKMLFLSFQQMKQRMEIKRTPFVLSNSADNCYQTVSRAVCVWDAFTKPYKQLYCTIGIIRILRCRIQTISKVFNRRKLFCFVYEVDRTTLHLTNLLKAISVTRKKFNHYVSILGNDALSHSERSICYGVQLWRILSGAAPF